MKSREKESKKLRLRDAADERQYLLSEEYEVYEKQGAPVGALAFHYHNFYEIIYVIEGEFSSLVENTAVKLKKGDFLLLDKNVMHKYHPVEDKTDASRRIILWITDTMLRELAGEAVDLSECFHGPGSHVYHFPVYYEEILRGFLLKLAMSDLLEAERNHQAGMRTVMDRGYLALFFGYLNILCQRKEYMFEGEGNTNHPLVQQVTYFVDEHMREEISVEDVADYVHMSKFYFLRKFKDITGMTVHSFIVNKRIINACQAISEGMSITEAWQSCGFCDYSSFLRNFRKIYGISPREYRESMMQ